MFLIWHIPWFLGGSYEKKDIQSLERGIIFQLIREQKLFLKLFLTEICLKFLRHHTRPILLMISGIRLPDI